MDRNDRNSNFLVGIISALAGAAAAMFLSKKENREKLGKWFDEAKSKGADVKDDLKDATRQLKNRSKKDTDKTDENEFGEF